MGRVIRTNNKDSWKLYSTISEGTIAKFETEKDLKKFIAQEAVYDGKLKAIEYLMTYPHKWMVNDEIIYNDDSKVVFQSYYDWQEEIQDSKTYEEYYRKIDDKLKELMS